MPPPAAKRPKLDGGSGGGDGNGGANNGSGGSGGNNSGSKPPKLGKDPSVRTDFLPDRERERMEEALRQKLKQEWLERQEAEKNEPLEVVYSYWDGAGHRRKITVRKGDTIGAFLKAVREQLAPEFRELRAVGTDAMMYVKEDLILPHHHTFHELIVNKARGKSGPLFDFGVTEDVRITNDATVEKADAHAGARLALFCIVVVFVLGERGETALCCCLRVCAPLPFAAAAPWSGARQQRETRRAQHAHTTPTQTTQTTQTTKQHHR